MKTIAKILEVRGVKTNQMFTAIIVMLDKEIPAMITDDNKTYRKSFKNTIVLGTCESINHIDDSIMPIKMDLVNKSIEITTEIKDDKYINHWKLL